MWRPITFWPPCATTLLIEANRHASQNLALRYYRHIRIKSLVPFLARRHPCLPHAVKTRYHAHSHDFTLGILYDIHFFHDFPISILVVFSTNLKGDPWWPVMTCDDPWWPAALVTQRHSESWQHVPVGRLTSGFVGRILELGLGTWELAEHVGFKRQNWEVNQRNLGRQRCGLSKQQEWWVKPCLKGDLRQKERMEVRKHTICLGHILLGYSLT